MTCLPWLSSSNLSFPLSRRRQQQNLFDKIFLLLFLYAFQNFSTLSTHLMSSINKFFTSRSLYVVLFILTWFLTDDQANSIGLSSQWYGGSLKTVWLLAFTNSSITYVWCNGFKRLTIRRSWRITILGCTTSPLLSNHCTMSAFRVFDVGTLSTFTEWYD